MLTFSDPFERLLRVAQERWGVSAHVKFVSKEELRKTWWDWVRPPKGMTIFPFDGSRPTVLISGDLSRGVRGTLDILAHELAHVAVGIKEGHGLRWRTAYFELYAAAIEQPTVTRVFKPQEAQGPWLVPVDKKTLRKVQAYLEDQGDAMSEQLCEELCDILGPVKEG